MFGGAVGSLKSETMLVDAILERENPSLRAVMFRRSYPELEKSLIRRSRELYGGMAGRYNEQKKTWTFPSGATVEFAYCEADKDIYRYQGAEYSFIGFDESTHFSEMPVRYMFSRLRSVDPSLRRRVRLASNPGNVGSKWHGMVFMGGHCICEICQPQGAEANVLPLEIYRSARWPDGEPVRLSTCFIPGRLRDHKLLPQDYADQTLQSLPATLRAALIRGCWQVFEGQYFDCWDPARMVVPRVGVDEQPWWSHWVGIDYGFVHAAAAYLFCRAEPTKEWPEGRIYALDEVTTVGANTVERLASEFARTVARRFQGEGMVQRRDIGAWYLSPDCWQKRGDANCLADQMAHATGINFTPASNDRAGGAVLLYDLLRSGKLVITDSCPHIIRAIPTRLHDPKEGEKVLKQPGDPGDDEYDALRYGAFSHLSVSAVPMDEQIARAMTSSDPTGAMMQRLAAMSRVVNSGRPQPYIHGHHRWTQ